MFSKKKDMKSLKIQDVSAECPSYTEEKETSLTIVEETAEGGKNRKIKKQKKSRMRKIRKKKRSPLHVLVLFLFLLVAAAAAFYFVGIPLLGGTSHVYVERVYNVMGLGSGNGTLNRYAGIVESQGEWTVKVDGNRRVKEVYVEEGDTVEVGDSLFSYDKDEIKLNLDRQNWNLNE